MIRILESAESEEFPTMRPGSEMAWKAHAQSRRAEGIITISCVRVLVAASSLIWFLPAAPVLALPQLRGLGTVSGLVPAPTAAPLSRTLPTPTPAQRAISGAAEPDICWKQSRGRDTGVDCTSAFPVNCGAACGVSDSACASVILDRAQSSSDLTLNVASLIATAGTVTPLLRAAQAAGRAARPMLTRAARDRLRRQAKAQLANALRWQRRSRTIDRAHGWLD